jgi:uncharacterized protein
MSTMSAKSILALRLHIPLIFSGLLGLFFAGLTTFVSAQTPTATPAAPAATAAAATPTAPPKATPEATAKATPPAAATSGASVKGAADYDPTKPVASSTQGQTGNSGNAPSTSSANPASAVAAVNASPVRGLLWEVTSKEGKKAFLFGTVHVGKPSFYPLPQTVQDALKASSRLAVEADVTDQADAAKVDRMMQYANGVTIDTQLPLALTVRLKAHLDKRRVPYQAVRSMRPVIIGGMLSIVEYVRLGYDLKLGLDLWLIDYAKREQMPIVQVESQVAQLTLLTGLSPALQEAFLDNALRVIELDRTSEQVTGVVNAWQAGDADLMLRVLKDNAVGMRESARIDEHLIYGRHPSMLQKVEGYIASGETHFVAVGSLHLIGSRGLVSLLANKGYTVKQL